VKPEATSTCQACGARVPPGLDFCPVCAFRGVLSDRSETTEIDVDLTDSSPASRFDHYQLLNREDGTPLELGHGAMGVTYKAIDMNLRCAVALKVISARLIGDESARRRFVREARAAASVRHPNVASVFHLGKSADGYFYAMEFVEGETLENLIKRARRLEPKIALEIARQVAAGLAAIHEQSLVHRDIKPTNIMVKLTDGGLLTAKIIDLGLAKPITDACTGVAISTPGAFAGTPEFASPEQFAGVPVDIRSDLYSLGVTLWEMLTGNAPFRGALGKVMHQHQHAPLPLERLEGLPQPLVVLLEVLLQKDPGRRFQDPAEFLKAIPAVTGAIDARRARTIRVFVSSPGDVQKERKLADNLIRSVAAEFGVRVSVTYSNLLRSNEILSTALESDDGTLLLCPYFWEYQREQLSEPRARLALLIDQLEELFTTGFSAEIQEKYVAAVSGLARSSRVFIIATLRSDFYANPKILAIEKAHPGAEIGDCQRGLSIVRDSRSPRNATAPIRRELTRRRTLERETKRRSSSTEARVNTVSEPK
jgi:serine/threonine protein kinase